MNRSPKTTLSTLQKRIWKAFCGSQSVEEIGPILQNEIDEQQQFLEGRVKEVYRLHRSRERNREVIKLAKEKAKKEGRYHCTVCGFSFIDTFGEEYIEAHHIHPIGERSGATYTKIEDLSMVCPNCHRMLHRRINGDWPGIDQLKKRIKRK